MTLPSDSVPLALIVVYRYGPVEVATASTMRIVDGPTNPAELAYLSKIVEAANRATSPPKRRKS